MGRASLSRAAPSGRSLFETHAHLLHSSAACRYPVFVGGGNYSGYAPAFLKTPILRHYIEDVLPEELNAIGDALSVLAKSDGREAPF